MDQPPRASFRGIRSGPSFVQPAQARAYAAHLRELAAQWDAAAELCERLRTESTAEPPAKEPEPSPPAASSNRTDVH
jgi:hypothetical protein